MASEPNFVWKIESKRVLSGEDKASILERMEAISALVAPGRIVGIPAFDENSVALTIRLAPCPFLQAEALARAREICGSGLTGLFARGLCFLRGLDAEARKRVDEGMAEKVLSDLKSIRLNAVRAELIAALRNSPIVVD